MTDTTPASLPNDPSPHDARITPGVVGPAETRKRILDAAVQEFADRGFAGARIDRIAADSGFNKQLIYRYYGNKQGLYEASFEALVFAVRGREDDEIDGATVIRGMVGDESDDAQRITRSMVRFIAWESMSGQATSESLRTNRARNYRAAIDWIRERQQAGELRDDVPAEFMTALIAVAGGVPYTMPSVLRFVLDQPDLSGEIRNQWREFVWKILRSR